jgi:hypothetical protein
LTVYISFLSFVQVWNDKNASSLAKALFTFCLISNTSSFNTSFLRIKILHCLLFLILTLILIKIVKFQKRFNRRISIEKKFLSRENEILGNVFRNELLKMLWILQISLVEIMKPKNSSIKYLAKLHLIAGVNRISKKWIIICDNLEWIY